MKGLPEVDPRINQGVEPLVWDILSLFDVATGKKMDTCVDVDVGDQSSTIDGGNRRTRWSAALAPATSRKIGRGTGKAIRKKEEIQRGSSVSTPPPTLPPQRQHIESHSEGTEQGPGTPMRAGMK